MNINIPLHIIKQISKRLDNLDTMRVIFALALVFSISSIVFSYTHDYIVAYGDAESHLNIAKRVVQGLTPGFAQLGGIWLPLPHVFLIPFVLFDPLWRSGLAGSIVSGISYIISCLFLFRLTYLITQNKPASFMGFLVFALNPNILYMQSTPMTELQLIMFFILSTYFLVKYIKQKDQLISLILAAFFGFCATLTRYDGWILVLCEAFVIILMYLSKRQTWEIIRSIRKQSNPQLISPQIETRVKNIWNQNIVQKMEGEVLLFSTLALFGIIIWLFWDYLILGDPLYFTNSQFSAKTQQAIWLTRGQLPAYHNILFSFIYYLVTSMSVSGILIFSISVIGLLSFVREKENRDNVLIALIMLVPFVYYVVTLFMGQSVIFIPHLTSIDFEWRLFNVRYGLIMVPTAAFFFSYFFLHRKLGGKMVILALFVLQFALFAVGYSKIITLADGVEGLSAAKRPDAEYWMMAHYDKGLVLIDDYARTMSIIRTHIPMQNIIYIGNKPYWEESFKEPEKYATWIIMQRNDEVWKNLYDNKETQGILYKYFQKVYTSPQILIFKRIQSNETS